MKRIFKYPLLLLVVCATTMNAHNPRNETSTVVTDSPEYSFDIQARGLFLKPGSNNLYYAAEAFPFNAAITNPAVSPHWQIYDLHPKYTFGFDLGFRFIMHSRQSSLYANWEHFKSTTSERAIVVSTAAYPNPMIGPFSSIGPDAADYNIEAQGCVTFNFNEANLRYGQYVMFGEYLETNFFAGISFANFSQVVQSFYAGKGNISQTITVPSSFIGAGPQIGVDFVYDIVCGFNLTGQAAVGLLMGTGKNHTRFASRSPLLVSGGDPSPNIQDTCVQNKSKLVPSFSERLGLAYHLSCCENSAAKFEVGFEAKMFINGFESTNLASGVIDVTPFDNTVGVFARTFERAVSNFSLFGPYLAVDISF